MYRISHLEINGFLTVLVADLAPLLCSEFVWIETSILGELVKNLSDLLGQNERLTADPEEGGKAKGVQR